MGFLDKVFGGINRAAAPVQDALVPTDSSLQRGAELEVSGRATTGTIVGIDRRLENAVTHTAFAVEAAGQRFGTEVTTTPHLHHLRLGAAVPVRVDGEGRGVIDWPALAAVRGLTSGEPGQRQRSAPSDGVADTAMDPRVEKRLREGRRTEATITGLERVSVLGMRSANWTVHLGLDDGSVCAAPKDEVPPYAWWAAAPGVRVPVALDAADPSVAAVDWPAVAVASAASAATDGPPAGSIGAEVDGAAGATPQSVAASPGDSRSVIAEHRDESIVNATLRDWVGEVQAGRMKPKAFTKYLAEWESAGMCTAAEADTARRAAGLA